jgi:hypothetical protein
MPDALQLGHFVPVVRALAFIIHKSDDTIAGNAKRENRNPAGKSEKGKTLA